MTREKKNKKWYFKRGTKGWDCAQPVLTEKEEEKEEERLQKPNLSMQNALTRGKRRRIVEEEEEKMGEALDLQHSLEAICKWLCL